MCLALSVVEACARDYCPCLVWGSGEPELSPEDRKEEGGILSRGHGMGNRLEVAGTSGSAGCSCD